MRKKLKYSIWLILISIVFSVFILFTTTFGLRSVIAIADSFIPGEINIENVNGSLIGDIQLQNVEFKSAEISINIGDVNIDLGWARLFSGELLVEEISIDKLHIIVAEIDAQGQDKENTLPDIVLPLGIIIKNTHLTDVRYRTTKDDAEIILDSILFDASFNDSELAINELDLLAYHSTLSISGSIVTRNNFPVNLATKISYPIDDQHQISGSGKVDGDLQELKITQSVSETVVADVTLVIKELMKKPGIDLNVKVNHVDSQYITSALIDTEISGQITANGDIDNIKLKSEIEISDKNIGLGNFIVLGAIKAPYDNYDINIEGDFVGLEIPDGRINLAVKGDYSGAEIKKLNAKILNGSVTGAATISWQDGFSILSSLNATGLETNSLHVDWPGKIGFSSNVNYKLQEEKTKLDLKVSELKGTLRESPLSANIDVSLDNNTLIIKSLEARFDKSTLVASGELNSKWNVSLDINSPDLSQILPDTSGEIVLSSHISGTRTQPTVKLDGSAKQLQYANNSIQDIKISIVAGVEKNSPIDIAIVAKELSIAAGIWSQAQLFVKGTTNAHDIEVDFTSEDKHIDLALQGSFEPWKWEGALKQTTILAPKLGQWALKSPSKIKVASNDINIDSLCLVQKQAFLCSKFHLNKKRYEARISGKAVSLAFLQDYLKNTLSLDGHIDIEAELKAEQNSPAQGSLLIMADKDVISLHFKDVEEKLVLGKTQLKADLKPEALKVNAHIPLQAGGDIRVDASLANWDIKDPVAHSLPVDATLQINKIPAAPIIQLIPQMGRAKGELQANIKVAGTLSQPRINGFFNWTAGTVNVPDLGITLSDMKIELQSSQTNTLSYSALARSGEGTLNITGKTVLQSDKGWPTEITFRSDKLEVANIPEALIIMDSDIQLKMQGSLININGEVTIPKARLRPRELPEGIATVSRDTVIIDKETKETDKSRMVVDSKIRVILGKYVDFRGFDVHGMLRGDLLLLSEPDKPTLAQGEVRIEDGTYRMRGQDLKIRKGRLIFANTFVDDPGIDVEAIREVETVIAGVKLTGTLQKPQLTIFSEPVMSESDALTYLLFGHAPATSQSASTESSRNTAAAMGFVAGDFLSQEVGGRLGLDEMRVDVGDTTEKTALVMGKYLSDKLYLRYFSGLVESSSIVQLRYQLSDRVQIQTEGGYRGSQSITGGDIFFTITY